MSKEKLPETEKPEREEPRVAVAMVQFVNPYDGFGIQGAQSALTSRGEGPGLRPESRHTIAWLPRLRVFEITYRPRDEDYVQIDMVPESSVKRWRRPGDWRVEK